MSRHATTSHLTVPVSDRDHARGPATAAVTLVEYGDYECPHCGQAFPIVEALIDQLGDQVRFVYRHFPLITIHPNSEPAAEAAEAAGAQDRFWEMHTMLFEHQDALDPESLVAYAEALGLSEARFVRELANHVYEPRVREDFSGGARSGVNGTPTFFINGIRHEGSYDFDTLLDAIQSHIE